MSSTLVVAPGFLTDVECWPLISQDTWYISDHGYVRRTGDAEYLHRVVTGCVPGDGKYVDHRNRNKLDNRLANLRVGTQADNMANCSSHRDARSKHKGVYPFRGRWQASFMRQGIRHHVGTFDTEDAAAQAIEVARG